ncbi:MAG: EutN/CcmL family microcompartment protein [Deltaproteobacteria bacterium]|nr:EutN/CcmL family microcompartment protein [Deltaproteobacteria bacterium]
MILGRVTGTVVSTAKHASYEGKKLLIVQPIDAKGAATGEEFLAVDRAQAGDGDRVLVLTEGNGVRQIFGAQGTSFPVLETIVGVVDLIEAENDA